MARGTASLFLNNLDKKFTFHSLLRYKKDMTDFIMLDYIYQTAALRPEIGVYILFTGDAHFQSVTKYLAQRLGKEVVIYGVTEAPYPASSGGPRGRPPRGRCSSG